jgi:uncharacterized protein
MDYRRIAGADVAARLATHGAVLIEGAKAVGKTTTGLALCASHVRLDRDAAARAAANADPRLVLDGSPPRLIDEYQLVPGLWEAVRGEIDERRAKGLFVLTGSATPDPETTSHGGAGRIARYTMRTLSQFERGRATGSTSLASLLDGATTAPDTARMSVREMIETLVIGGWPGHADLDVASAMDANADYLETIVHVDVPRTDGVRRDPQALMRFVRGYARNVATNASLTRIAAHGERSLSPNTRTDYVRALERLFLVEDQGAWAPRLRSRIRLSATPKRHLTDPSLAIAALGATPERLLSSEIEWTGFLFESLVVHDLRVLAGPRRAQVRYYQDNKGLEIDAIVERRDGRWLGVEVKLGVSQVDAAAANLLAMRDKLDAEVRTACSALLVVVADSPTYLRKDGVVVTSLASLGP